MVPVGWLLRWSLLGIRAICEERGNRPADGLDGPTDRGP
jgi:hypothetical protein